jgi:hypothetical protein
MSGMVKENKRGILSDLSHTRRVPGALGLRSKRVPVGKTGEKREISWHRKK